MEQALGIFQNRVVCRITRRQKMMREEGGRDYPLLPSAMEEVGFEKIGAYIQKRQNMVA